MNTTIESCDKIISEIVSNLSSVTSLDNSSYDRANSYNRSNRSNSNNISIVICPPFTNLMSASSEIKKSTEKIFLGAQNCYHQPKGAFTGEISIEMLTALDCKYVIIGHSERRAYFGETDTEINKKLLALLEAGLTPILCIGETLEERKAGNTFSVLKMQLDGCLQNISNSNSSNSSSNSNNSNNNSNSNINKVVIAYEPVWAIGTGVSATIPEVEEAHNWLRKYFVEKYSEAGEEVYLLYGGSLNDANAPQILAVTNVNGGLIGGASLEPQKFVSIIKTAAGISPQA